MMNYKQLDLERIVAGFKSARVLVIGDVILDQFIWGSVSRISPEAPVPVVNVQKEEFLLGGSANVLRNIASMSGAGGLCGIVGEDSMADTLFDLLAECGCEGVGLARVDRPTTVKTRVVAQGQQIVRFDREKAGSLSEEVISSLYVYLKDNLLNFDAVVVSDYAKGVVDNRLMSYLQQLLSELRRAEGIALPLIVDPKPSNADCFSGATVITPNQHEAEQVSGVMITDEQSLLQAGTILLARWNCHSVLITMGEAGMALFERGKDMVTIPAVAREVYDVTGAGDTVVAAMALSLVAGCSLPESAFVANQAAGIVVAKVGTASVTTEELTKAFTMGGY